MAYVFSGRRITPRARIAPAPGGLGDWALCMTVLGSTTGPGDVYEKNHLAHVEVDFGTGLLKFYDAETALQQRYLEPGGGAFYVVCKGKDAPATNWAIKTIQSGKAIILEFSRTDEVHLTDDPEKLIAHAYATEQGARGAILSAPSALLAKAEIIAEQMWQKSHPGAEPPVPGVPALPVPAAKPNWAAVAVVAAAVAAGGLVLLATRKPRAAVARANRRRRRHRRRWR